MSDKNSTEILRTATSDELTALTRDELKASMTAAGIAIPKRPSKAKLVAAILSWQAEQAPPTEEPTEGTEASTEASGEEPSGETTDETTESAPPELDLDGLDPALAAALTAHIAKAVAAATPAKPARKRKKKETPPLFIEQARAPFALPDAETVKGLDPLQRLNIVLDACEVVGCGEKLVGAFEKTMQRVIEKHFNVTYAQGVAVPRSLLAYFKVNSIDLAALPNAKAVREAMKAAADAKGMDLEKELNGAPDAPDAPAPGEEPEETETADSGETASDDSSTESAESAATGTDG